MLRVGLTGGVACGKTTVGKMFAEMGAHVIQADLVAHELMQPGQPVYDQVVKHFGREILRQDGSINRASLAEAAFGGGRIEELNRIVHPAVIARQEQRLDEFERIEPSGIGVVEAALILEAGLTSRFDKLIAVTCRPEQKVDRFAARQGLDLQTASAEVARRQAAQLSDERKVAAADFVIDASGSLEDTRAQVAAVYASLQPLAAVSS